MICVNCGRALEAESEFCPYCGAEQVPAAPPVAAPVAGLTAWRTGLDQFAPTAFQARKASDFLFMAPLIARLNDGRFFKRVVSIVLYVVAVLFAVAGLIAWVAIGVSYFDEADNVGAVLGGLLLLIVFPVLPYMLVHVIVIRARDIGALQDYGGFTVIPIVSIFLKLVGEWLAIVYACFTIAGGLFPGLSPLGLFFGRGLGFGGGLGFGWILLSLPGILVGLIPAFFLLAYFYFLSEMVRVLAEIAVNTRRTSEALPQPAAEPVAA